MHMLCRGLSAGMVGRGGLTFALTAESVCVWGGGSVGCRKRSHFSPALSAVSELWAPAKRSFEQQSKEAQTPTNYSRPLGPLLPARTPLLGRRSTQIPRRRCGWVGA
ncbi:hypothetical protein L1887_55045 [Cichorium endivia]|nr:hypothetical protein L1887_55045 [Cichorium endivia]